MDNVLKWTTGVLAAGGGAWGRGYRVFLNNETAVGICLTALGLFLPMAAVIGLAALGRSLFLSL
jgi:hypothetical protein